jgi:hypothetical protein
VRFHPRPVGNLPYPEVNQGHGLPWTLH